MAQGYILYVILATAAGLVAANFPIGRYSPDEDISVAIVDSTIARFSPETVGPWQYFTGLYLLGQYQVYKRTEKKEYLTYIQEWADRFVDDDGYVNITFNSLDSMQAGNVFLVLYEETSQDKYQKAASQIREAVNTYPRTSDGAFWHATSLDYQLWADGTFMINPFLVQHGAMFGDSDSANREASDQLILYGKHLQVDNGLLQHAYDESRAESWADPETGRSAEQWCRAMGWYGLAIMDVTDLLPPDHANFPSIVETLRKFAEGIKRYQDDESGRWFQVVNRGDLEDNWTETSCSAMFVNTLSRAIQKGYIGDEYAATVTKGYRGVIERVVTNSEGLTDVVDICIGTGVGDLPFYLNRPRETNDLHGLGAVLLMLERVPSSSST
jgi:unsaturated rhamnogalacturonyl hydrolase